MLACRNGRADSLVLSGRVIDPTGGIDEALTVTIDNGVITRIVSNAAAPFGGMKASGFGREGGFEGIEEYLETTYVGIA